MSPIGTKQTLASAMQMSAFEGKADLALGMFYEYTPFCNGPDEVKAPE